LFCWPFHFLFCFEFHSGFLFLLFFLPYPSRVYACVSVCGLSVVFIQLEGPSKIEKKESFIFIYRAHFDGLIYSIYIYNNNLNDVSSLTLASHGCVCVSFHLMTFFFLILHFFPFVWIPHILWCFRSFVRGRNPPFMHSFPGWRENMRKAASPSFRLFFLPRNYSSIFFFFNKKMLRYFEI
jgi:hypothetical protein